MTQTRRWSAAAGPGLAMKCGPSIIPPMDRPAAIAQIREACKNIALQFMKIHPALPHLQDQEAQNECIRSLHEMTVLLETIKKRVGRLERSDDSSLL